MTAIDMHTHAFPDEIAERAMAKLQASATDYPARGDGTVAGLLRSMDAADIDVAVVCAIATRPGQAKGILKWCDKIRSDRVEPLPSVHPDDADAADWIRRIAKEGFRGIKLHPQYQSFAADEDRASAIYDTALDRGLVVASHCGLDLAYPPDDDRASPVRFARVLDRFGGLKLLATHMGGWRSWDDVQKLLLGRPIWLETSFSLEELGPEKSVEMIRRHGVDRVCFGTDWPWKDQAEEMKRLGQIGLTDKELAQVFYSNAAALLQL